jgi:hypothetical protein
VRFIIYRGIFNRLIWEDTGSKTDSFFGVLGKVQNKITVGSLLTLNKPYIGSLDFRHKPVLLNKQTDFCHVRF